MSFLLYLALLTVSLYLLTGVYLIRGLRRIKFLKDVPLKTPSKQLPFLSLIIPCRNEEAKLAGALETLQHQRYPHLEIIAVNDRSEDHTPEILQVMATRMPNLRIIHISNLPEDQPWLGKNYALYRGASQASGELLLFCDADVHLTPEAIEKAVNHLLHQGLDHLTVGPDTRMASFILQSFLGTFTIFFNLFARPWNVPNPRKKEFVGIGAFNLVRRSAYIAAGTHRAIAMRPDDDMKLGKLFKQHGFRSELLYGKGLIAVEWYQSIPELIDGLMKNMFSGVDYRAGVIVLASIVQLIFMVWPFAALLLTGGWIWLLNLGAVLMIIAVAGYTARFSNYTRWFGIALPVTTLLFIYIQWKAMILTYTTGGIRWRGTHYPLEQLKRNQL